MCCVPTASWCLNVQIKVLARQPHRGTSSRQNIIVLMWNVQKSKAVFIENVLFHIGGFANRLLTPQQSNVHHYPTLLLQQWLTSCQKVNPSNSEMYYVTIQINWLLVKLFILNWEKNLQSDVCWKLEAKQTHGECFKGWLQYVLDSIKNFKLDLF